MSAGICLYPGDEAELLLRNQESRPFETLSLVAPVPKFHVSANLLHNCEHRLDHVRAGQRLVQLQRDVKPSRQSIPADDRRVVGVTKRPFNPGDCCPRQDAVSLFRQRGISNV